MKRPVAIALLAAIWLPASLPGVAALDYVSTVQGTSGLLGYWRFDTGSQANSLVNGYTGSFMGNATLGAAGTGPSLAADPNNRPLVLDGSGDYVVTNLTGGITSAGSVVVWVYLPTQPGTVGRTYSITAQGQYANDFDFQIQTPDNRTYFYTDAGSATVYNTALPLDTWVFLAATFTANGAREVFVNGASVASSTAGGHSTNTEYPFSIGENLKWPGRFFQGSIDEVAVFNRVLSAAEIANIYAAAQVIPEPAEMGLLSGALVLLAAVVRQRRRRASAQ